MSGGALSFWWFMALVLGVAIVLSVVATLLTRQRPYECPPGRSVALTLSRHTDGLPVLAALLAAGIDADLIEETAKPLWRRALFYRLYAPTRPYEPAGPWHVVVPTSAMPEVERCLSATASAATPPADANPA